MKMCLLPLLLSLAAAILIRQPAETLATNEEILAEIQRRVELCEASGGPLAPVALDALFAELKLRQVEKICEPPSHAPAETTRPPTPRPPAETGTTTTTTMTPCPSDNFMDEIIDQPNPDFDIWDANKDGCLTEEEMTGTLRKQRDVARERDYYWLRKNATAAAARPEARPRYWRGRERYSTYLSSALTAAERRRLERQWRAHHDGADADGGGCLNREELEIIQHAVCDCGTQFLFMDHSADGKISQQEAATYVAEHMSHADLNYVKLRAIWKVADVDEDGFLSPTEFCEAGPRYKGDGDDKGDGDEKGDGDHGGSEDPLRAIAEIPGTDDPDPLLRDA